MRKVKTNTMKFLIMGLKRKIIAIADKKQKKGC